MKLNRNHFASLFRNDFKTVAVVFDDTPDHFPSHGKQYTYKLPKDEAVQVGDKLLVVVHHSRNNPGGEYKLTTVVEVNETPAIDGEACFNYKWALGTIGHLIERREQNIERDQKLKAAVAKLEAALERRMLQKQVSEMLAELPEEEAAEFKALFGAPNLPGLGTETKPQE